VDKRKMVLLGGGEIGRFGTQVETREIDQRIKDLSTERLENKEKIDFLFIPTASSDNEDYCRIAKNYFETEFNYSVSSLKIIENPPRFEELQNTILNSNVIYIGGGNTRMMVDLWQKHKIDILLKQAWEKGTILSGLSAGLNCFFERAITDSNKTLDIMDFMGVLSGTVTPHYDTEKSRPAFIEQLFNEGKIKNILALEDNTAIEIDGTDKFKILKSDETANVYYMDANESITLNKDQTYSLEEMFAC